MPEAPRSNAVEYAVLGVLSLLALAEAAWFYPRMPERVATHFQGNGVADGYGSRGGLLALHLGLGLGLPLFFGGLAWLLPRIPVALINLPHRDHWLAPERREATLQRVTRMLLQAAGLTQALLLAVFLGIYGANRSTGGVPRLSSWSWAALGLYLAALAVVLLRGLWIFLRAPAEGRPQARGAGRSG